MPVCEPFRYRYEDENMLIHVRVRLNTQPYERKVVRVLAHAWTDQHARTQHVHGAHTAHARIHHDRRKLEAVDVTVLLPFYSSGAKQLICGFSIVLLGSSSAKSDPAVTRQISRL